MRGCKDIIKNKFGYGDLWIYERIYEGIKIQG